MIALLLFVIVIVIVVAFGIFAGNVLEWSFETVMQSVMGLALLGVFIVVGILIKVYGWARFRATLT